MTVTASHIPVPPLNSFNQIPISVTAQAAVTMGKGEAYVTGPSSFGILASTMVPSYPASVTRTQTVSLVVDQPYQITLYASVGAYASADIQVWSAVGQAVADPTFGFDQDAFDTLQADWGLDSFSLESYFAFQYSPNLVPEPSMLVAQGMTLVTLCIVCTVRRRIPKARWSALA